MDHVQVRLVLWNGGVFDPTSLHILPAFYTALAGSVGVFVNNEYNTHVDGGTMQTISAGSYVAGVIDLGQSATVVADSDIQTALQSITPLDPNTLYMVHFPPGTAVFPPNILPSDGIQFAVCHESGPCGFHHWFTFNGTVVKYAAIPDYSNDCRVGTGTTCFTSTHENTYTDAMTVVASHELLEAVTDPQGARLLPPSAWTGAQGEIGDLCEGQTSAIPGTTPVNCGGTTFQVTKVYDRVNGGCFAPVFALLPCEVAPALPTWGLFGLVGMLAATGIYLSGKRRRSVVAT
jgi:hypothetical protein